MKDFDNLQNAIETKTREFDKKILLAISKSKRVAKLLNGANLRETEYLLKSLINMFTTNENERDISYFIKNLKNIYTNFDGKLMMIPSDNCKKLNLKINGKDFIISKLSDVVEGILLNFPELETSERISNPGFLFSFLLANSFARNGVECQLVTGNIYGITSVSEYLRSWVELEDGMVFDYSLNAVLRKNLFKYITDCNEISRIDGYMVAHDYNEISEKLDLLSDDDLKGYLCFHDDYMKEICGSSKDKSSREKS